MHLLALALVAGCDNDDDTGEDVEGCRVAVDETFPADGSVDAYIRDTIQFDLSDADPTATLTSDIPGDQETADDYRTVWWVPDAPLTPETSYEVRLSACFGTYDLAFTTSAFGLPMEDPTVVAGRAYQLDLSEARYIQPGGLGVVLAEYLEKDLLLAVTDAGDGGIDFLGAFTDDAGVGQDLCLATIPFGGGVYSEAPYFTIGPRDVVVGIAGNEVAVTDVVVTGTFSGDGEQLGGATLSGLMDTRGAADIIEPGNPEAICQAALNYGDTCVPCPDGTTHCIQLELIDMTATAVDGLAIHEVAADACAGCETWTSDTVPPVEGQTCTE